LAYVKEAFSEIFFLFILQFDFAHLSTVNSKKKEKRFTKRGEKCWLRLLLVKCKSPKNGFSKIGVLASMVLSKNNTAFGNKIPTKGVVLLGTALFKCSRHLVLKFCKIV